MGDEVRIYDVRVVLGVGAVSQPDSPGATQVSGTGAQSAATRGSFHSDAGQ